MYGFPFLGVFLFFLSDCSFLLFNANSWGVAVNEDEGSFGDHYSGVGASDGIWHHGKPCRAAQSTT